MIKMKEAYREGQFSGVLYRANMVTSGLLGRMLLCLQLEQPSYGPCFWLSVCDEG